MAYCHNKEMLDCKWLAVLLYFAGLKLTINNLYMLGVNPEHVAIAEPSLKVSIEIVRCRVSSLLL